MSLTRDCRDSNTRTLRTSVSEAESLELSDSILHQKKSEFTRGLPPLTEQAKCRLLSSGKCLAFSIVISGGAVGRSAYKCVNVFQCYSRISYNKMKTDAHSNIALMLNTVLVKYLYINSLLSAGTTKNQIKTALS